MISASYLNRLNRFMSWNCHTGKSKRCAVWILIVDAPLQEAFPISSMFIHATEVFVSSLVTWWKIKPVWLPVNVVKANCDFNSPRSSTNWRVMKGVTHQYVEYRQPNKIIEYLIFHKWLLLVCNIHTSLCMLQTKTSHLWKVTYAIILLGWRYYALLLYMYLYVSYSPSNIFFTYYWLDSSGT